MLKPGVLLVNLGTTAHPTYWSVMRFLREFLSDKRVVDIPWFFRTLLLYGCILPFRPWGVAHAYKSIWTPQGSPLLAHQESLTQKIKLLLPKTPIALAMRYGQPSIKKALDTLKEQGVQHIMVIPLFPQYAAASTGTALAKIYEEVSTWWDPPTLDIQFDFFDAPGFIEAQSATIAPMLQEQSYDLIVYSFHGVPVRHLQKSGCSVASQCQQQFCARADGPVRLCYKAQCLRSAQLIHAQLDVDIPYQVAFQSRLGRTPWIKPYLDESIFDWHKLGYKNLLVVCPSFSADCLETLEEIGDRLKTQWEELSGGRLDYAACVNDSDRWAKTLAEWINNKIHTHQQEFHPYALEETYYH